MSGAPEPVAVTLSPEAVEAIAERAAEIVFERLRQEAHAPRQEWLYGARAAAVYLGWPVKRVYNRLARIPHHRDGSRLIFRVSELDEWAATAGGSVAGRSGGGASSPPTA